MFYKKSLLYLNQIPSSIYYDVIFIYCYNFRVARNWMYWCLETFIGFLGVRDSLSWPLLTDTKSIILSFFHYAEVSFAYIFHFVHLRDYNNKYKISSVSHHFYPIYTPGNFDSYVRYRDFIDSETGCISARTQLELYTTNSGRFC